MFVSIVPKQKRRPRAEIARKRLLTALVCLSMVLTQAFPSSIALAAEASAGTSASLTAAETDAAEQSTDTVLAAEDTNAASDSENPSASASGGDSPAAAGETSTAADDATASDSTPAATDDATATATSGVSTATDDTTATATSSVSTATDDATETPSANNATTSSSVGADSVDSGIPSVQALSPAAIASAGTSAIVPLSDGEEPSEYNLWVNGAPVTAANKDNISLYLGSAKYDPESETLTLSSQGSTASSSIVAKDDCYNGAAIKCIGDLHIIAWNESDLSGSKYTNGTAAGLYVSGKLTIDLESPSKKMLITGGQGLDYSTGIYTGGKLSITGASRLQAIGRDAAMSVGICAGMDDSASDRTVTISGGTQVGAYSEGDSLGTSASKTGVFAGGQVKVEGTSWLYAIGYNAPHQVSGGIIASGLEAKDQARVEGIGGEGRQSFGVAITSGSSASGSIVLSGSSTLTAKGAAASMESSSDLTCSCGIRADGSTVTVGDDATLKATAETASGSAGTSIGILGQLVFDGGDATDAAATASSGTATTSKALNEMPLLIDGYRWATDTMTTWQYGASNPFKYAGTETSVSFTAATFPLWVGGVQVNAANMKDVLAGTPNAGKVSFEPAATGTGLGTLTLSNATIEGVAGEHAGAGIYANGELTLALNDDNMVYGASFSERNAGIKADGLTIGGTGSLVVYADPAASDSFAIALDAEDSTDGSFSGLLLVKDSAIVTASLEGGNGFGANGDDVKLQDSASLTGTGAGTTSANPVAKSYGVGAGTGVTLSGNSSLTGFGDRASDCSGGVTSQNITVEDNASLTAEGSAVTGSSLSAGKSYGYISTGGSFTVTGGRVTLQTDSTSGDHSACNIEPDLSGYAGYRWRTTNDGAWSYYPGTAYAYDSSQTYVAIEPPLLNLWVGGVQVSTTNMKDVLGDGTVSYVPADATYTAGGTLTLKGAHLEGTLNVNNGAGIYSDMPLTVQLEGRNVVSGANAVSIDAYGMRVLDSLTFQGTGSLSIEAGGASAGSSTGLYCESGTSGLTGNLTIKDSVTLDCAGGLLRSSSASNPHPCVGIFAEGTATVEDSAVVHTTAQRGVTGVNPAASIAFEASRLVVQDSSTVTATGMDGDLSSGILVTDGPTLRDSALLFATGSDGVSESYGIYTTDGLTLDGGQLKTQASSASTTAKVRAISKAPTNNMTAYHWRVGDADSWTSYPSTAYVYDTAQTYVEVGSAYDLKVGGVTVTDANKDNVLAGTANDGKVKFVAGSTNGSIGTLKLAGANITGVDGVDCGAGIVSQDSAFGLDVTGDNTVTGGAGGIAEKAADGILAPRIDITGDGSLNVTAADMPQVNGVRSNGVQANVTMGGNVRCSFAGGTCDIGTGLYGSLDMTDAATLTCTGGTTSKSSYGVWLTGLNMDGQAHLTATGGTAPSSEGVLIFETKATIGGQSVLQGTGGTATLKSYGLNVYADNPVPFVVADDATLALNAGSVPATGTRRASTGELDLTSRNAYRWKTSSSVWKASTTDPFVFNASDTSIDIEQLQSYLLWVGGVQVNAVNQDNILAGTANDGKAKFVPDESGSAGTLYLSGTNIDGVGGAHYGAGIYSDIPVDISLAGSNVVTGAAGSPYEDDLTVSSIEGTAISPASDDATTLVAASSTDALAPTADGEAALTPANDDGAALAPADDNLSATEGDVILACGVFGMSDLKFIGDGTLDVTAQSGDGSVALCGLQRLTVGGNAAVTATAASATVMSVGARATDMLVESGLLDGSAASAPKSYGIAGAEKDSLAITGGTIIGQTAAAAGTGIGAFNNAVDTSKDTSYKWRASKSADYTYGNYVFTASDTYEEITPGVAPVTPGGGGTSGSTSSSTSGGTANGGNSGAGTSSLANTGDENGALPYALCLLVMLAGGSALALDRRRKNF